MIHPKMATMLCFITSDASIAPELLNPIVKHVVDGTFNNLTIDGDTSTNDMVLALANGASGVTVSSKNDLARFEEAFFFIASALCKKIAEDGEGATKRVEINVTGASTYADAKLAAKAVANSNLVKTALFGNDPNWGRVLAAIGTTSAVFEPDDLGVAINGIAVCRSGAAGDDRGRVDHEAGDRELRAIGLDRPGQERQAAWPAYRLGLRILGDARAAFFMALALLLYPPLQYAVLNEFHPVTLAIPLLLFAFLFIEERRWWWAAPFLVLAALCKEEIPLVIAVMGAYFALRQRSWRPLILTALAAAYFVVAVKVVLPHFSPGGSPFLTRYADLGSSVGGIGANVLLKPGVTLRHVFGWSNVRYLLQLLWPFGFSSLLSPLTTLIGAPEYALNALASNSFQRSYEFHYVAGEVPFLFAGAVLGVARARELECSRPTRSLDADSREV